MEVGLLQDLAALDYLKDDINSNIADAHQRLGPSYGHWADVVVKHYSCLGMAWPFSSLA